MTVKVFGGSDFKHNKSYPLLSLGGCRVKNRLYGGETVKARERRGESAFGL